MTDWTTPTGRTGTMMIRDTGTVVEFWLKAASDTYNYYGIYWSYSANGKNSSARKVFPSGGNWLKLGSVTVTTDQTVGFYIRKTGTTGLGGPTAFLHSITRQTVPPAPDMGLYSYTDTTVNVNVNTNGNGGVPIDQIQVMYGTDRSAMNTSYTGANLVDGTGVISGLSRGETYYMHARMHNTKGWSSWSNTVAVRMKSAPSKMGKPYITNITQQTVYFKMSAPFDGNSPITGYRIGYGTSPDAPTDYIYWNIALTRGVYHLNPGTTYYFWAQAENAYGNSYLSDPSSALVQAGAMVNVNGTWKRAVPYVNVGGVWKLAQPWVRHAGKWKETQ